MQGVEALQADFRGADLRQVNFGGAYLEGAVLPPPVAKKPALPSLGEQIAHNDRSATPQRDGHYNGLKMDCEHER
jgi:hypothetical protein